MRWRRECLRCIFAAALGARARSRSSSLRPYGRGARIEGGGALGAVPSAGSGVGKIGQHGRRRRLG